MARTDAGENVVCPDCHGDPVSGSDICRTCGGACVVPQTALTPEVLQKALAQLRALEAAGEDPRNANQRWDVTPEQAGALLAHLDDVEQKRAQVQAHLARVIVDRDAGDRRNHELRERHAAAVLVMADGSLFSDYLRNAAPEDLPMDGWTKGYETCKRRLAAILLPQLAPAQEASDGK